jgi:hypothetical protein
MLNIFFKIPGKVRNNFYTIFGRSRSRSEQFRRFWNVVLNYEALRTKAGRQRVRVGLPLWVKKDPYI